MKYLILILACTFSTLLFAVTSIDDMDFSKTDLIIEKDPSALTGARAHFLGSLWTDGIIPIKFSSGVSAAKKVQFIKACSEWALAANVQCKLFTKEKMRLEIELKQNKGCRSHIGMPTPNWEFGIDRAVMNLAKGCWRHDVILHELGHAFGLIHEHQRSDRGKYLKIISSNVPFTKLGNFIIIPWSKDHTEYDFLSIMHYDSLSFSKDRKNKKYTIVPKAPYQEYRDKIGRGRHLSDGDKKIIAELYGN